MAGIRAAIELAPPIANGSIGLYGATIRKPDVGSRTLKYGSQLKS